MKTGENMEPEIKRLNENLERLLNRDSAKRTVLHVNGVCIETDDDYRPLLEFARWIMRITHVWDEAGKWHNNHKKDG